MPARYENAVSSRVNRRERVPTHSIHIAPVVVDAARDVELHLRQELDLILRVDRIDLVVDEGRALDRLDVERRLHVEPVGSRITPAVAVFETRIQSIQEFLA